MKKRVKPAKPPIGKVSFDDAELNPKLHIDKIDMSPENVRKTEVMKGLPEIEGSIDRIGLIQPIVVLKKGDRYQCVVGQRRLLATKELGDKTIPALIIGNLDELTQSLVSFGENIHRAELPYGDTMDVLNKLFKAYSGSPPQKINQIAADLGLRRKDVMYYLASQLVPKKLQDMVDEGKITHQKAYGITESFWPDEKRMLSIASQVGQLTGTEFKRALQIGQEKPKEPVDKVIEEAKKPSTVIRLALVMSKEMADKLQVEADKLSKKVGHTVTISDLILQTIERFLTEGA